MNNPTGFGVPVRPIHPDFMVGSSTLHAPRAHCAPMGKQPLKGDLMKSSVTNLVMALGLGHVHA